MTRCKRQDETGDTTGQKRTGQDRTGQDMTGHNRTGQDAIGETMPKESKISLSKNILIAE